MRFASFSMKCLSMLSCQQSTKCFQSKYFQYEEAQRYSTRCTSVKVGSVCVFFFVFSCWWVVVRWFALKIVDAQIKRIWSPRICKEHKEHIDDWLFFFLVGRTRKKYYITSEKKSTHTHINMPMLLLCMWLSGM